MAVANFVVKLMKDAVLMLREFGQWFIGILKKAAQIFISIMKNYVLYYLSWIWTLTFIPIFAFISKGFESVSSIAPVSVRSDYPLHVTIDALRWSYKAELIGYRTEYYVPLLEAKLWCVVFNLTIEAVRGAIKYHVAVTLNMVVNFVNQTKASRPARTGDEAAVVQTKQFFFRSKKNGWRVLNMPVWKILANETQTLLIEEFVPYLANPAISQLIGFLFPDMVALKTFQNASFLQLFFLVVLVKYAVFAALVAAAFLTLDAIVAITTAAAYASSLLTPLFFSAVMRAYARAHAFWGVPLAWGEFLESLKQAILLDMIMLGILAVILIFVSRLVPQTPPPGALGSIIRKIKSLVSSILGLAYGAYAFLGGDEAKRFGGLLFTVSTISIALAGGASMTKALAAVAVFILALAGLYAVVNEAQQEAYSNAREVLNSSDHYPPRIELGSVEIVGKKLEFRYIVDDESAGRSKIYKTSVALLRTPKSGDSAQPSYDPFSGELVDNDTGINYTISIPLKDIDGKKGTKDDEGLVNVLSVSVDEASLDTRLRKDDSTWVVSGSITFKAFENGALKIYPDCKYYLLVVVVDSWGNARWVFYNVTEYVLALGLEIVSPEDGSVVGGDFEVRWISYVAPIRYEVYLNETKVAELPPSENSYFLKGVKPARYIVTVRAIYSFGYAEDRVFVTVKKSASSRVEAAEPWPVGARIVVAARGRASGPRVRSSNVGGIFEPEEGGVNHYYLLNGRPYIPWIESMPGEYTPGFAINIYSGGRDASVPELNLTERGCVAFGFFVLRYWELWGLGGLTIIVGGEEVFITFAYAPSKSELLAVAITLILLFFALVVAYDCAERRPR